jgi:5-methyltetrahydrofolate--homocysteine methyltransferase
VKSAQQMVITAADLREVGIRLPLLVGGAALSEKFTRGKITPAYEAAVCYSKDALTGLRLLNQIMDPATREALLAAHVHSGPAVGEGQAEAAVGPQAQARGSKVRTDIPIPPAPKCACLFSVG